MTVDMRLAKVEDADLLSQLSVEIQEMHASQHPDFFKQGVAQNYAVEFFRSVLGEPNMQAWIVQVDGNPAGYLLLELRDRQENAFVHPQPKVHVDHIAVLAAFQGQGLGRVLMAQAEQVAQDLGSGMVTLNVWAFNQEAIGFYERLGYSTYAQNMWKKLD